MQSKDRSWISLIKKTEKERKKNKIKEHWWDAKKKEKKKNWLKQELCKNNTKIISLEYFEICIWFECVTTIVLSKNKSAKETKCNSMQLSFKTKSKQIKRNRSYSFASKMRV